MYIYTITAYFNVMLLMLLLALGTHRDDSVFQPMLDFNKESLHDACNLVEAIFASKRSSGFCLRNVMGITITCDVNIRVNLNIIFSSRLTFFYTHGHNIDRICAPTASILGSTCFYFGLSSFYLTVYYNSVSNYRTATHTCDSSPERRKPVSTFRHCLLVST